MEKITMSVDFLANHLRAAARAYEDIEKETRRAAPLADQPRQHHSLADQFKRQAEQATRWAMALEAATWIDAQQDVGTHSLIVKYEDAE